MLKASMAQAVLASTKTHQVLNVRRRHDFEVAIIGNEYGIH